MPEKRFKIALSFAGEHREYVSQVADFLAAQLGQDAVFYDLWYQAELARPNLDTHLQKIYHQESQLLVPFFCANYERKEWCGLEWRAIRDLLKKRQDEDIMPVRFDNADISGLFSIDGYIDLQNYTPEETANFILKRLKGNNNSPK